MKKALNQISENISKCLGYFLLNTGLPPRVERIGIVSQDVLEASVRLLGCLVMTRRYICIELKNVYSASKLGTEILGEDIYTHTHTHIYAY